MRLGPPKNPNAQAVEVDLVQLEVQKQKHEDELRRDILTKIENHHKWNRNHVDLTKNPLPPVRSPGRQPFRTAQAQYLLTPPASSTSQDSLEEPEPMDLDDPAPLALFQFRGALVDDNDPPKIAFRRRVGRLNRLWIDRRTVANTPPRDPQDADLWKHHQESDRWKYDHDDSEDEQPVYEVDPYDTRCIRFRATIPLGFGEARRPARTLPPAHTQAAQLDPAAAQQAAMQAAAARQGAPAQRTEG